MEGQTNIKHDSEMLKIEYAKLELEKKRLEAETRNRTWTAIAVLVPIFLGLATLWYDMWNQNQQAKRDFALKAAEIVMSSNSPYVVSGKLRALKELFPESLPSNIETFNPELFDSGPSYENSMNFLRLIVDSGKDRETIIAIYNKIFPGSEIIKAITRDDSLAPTAQQPH